MVQHMLCVDQKKKKKVQKMGKKELKYVLLKKENKNQSRSSFDPISSSNYDLLALSHMTLAQILLLEDLLLIPGHEQII